MDYRIAAGGMGQYLTPPNHPSQKYQIETDLKRKKENRGIMNIEYALEQEYVPVSIKLKIKAILNDWDDNKLPLNHADTIKWIDDCKRHFEGLPNDLKDYVKKYYPNWKNK